MGCVGLRAGTWRFEYLTIFHLGVWAVSIGRNARANDCSKHEIATLPVIRLWFFAWPIFLVPFAGCDSPDLGTHRFIRNSTQCAKRKSQSVRDDCHDDANPSHRQA